MNKKQIIKALRDCFNCGGKLIIFGNGGSMAEASHFAGEFVGIGLPAVALSDPAIISGLSNDFGYENIFCIWISAIGTDKDLVIGISSSGKSRNINKALEYAKELGCESIDFPRKGKTTSEVQNRQLKLIHQIYEEFKK